MIYRKEIDGLRALAVLPVILFHAGFSLFPGGYVGVDVFFVISGYLITSNILEELAIGSFTLAGFYERRVRRILPALFFVLLCCLPFAWWLLLPEELEDFSKSLMAVTGFVSNILFWLQTDYFAPNADQIPLLHTWSLAIEEQYYLLFPLFMLLVWKWGRYRLIGVMAMVALTSLGVSEWLWRQSVEANFYLMASRTWELVLGAMAAVYLYRHSFAQGLAAQLAGLTGLALLAYSIFFLDNNIPFPSLYALFPTVGALLIILFASNTSWAGRVLSCRVLTGIGLISYSAYLWHQPVFVFARMQSLEELGAREMLALSVLSLLMAWFSWLWIEKPFRNRQNFSRKQVFIAAIAGSLFFLIIGAWLVWAEGVPSRFTS